MRCKQVKQIKGFLLALEPLMELLLACDTLDALCDRLAVTIPEADRHTAIGDAIGTADAFARMIPMMQAAGLPTLGETIAAFDKHARLIRHLN